MQTGPELTRADKFEVPSQQSLGDQHHQSAAPQLTTRGERTLFVEEAAAPGTYLKVVANGDYDEIALEALAAFVERAKRRMKQGAH